MKHGFGALHSVFNPCFIRGSKSFGKAEGTRQKAEKSKRLRRILVSGFFILPSSLACRRSLAVERGEHGVGRRVVAARAGRLDVEQGGLEIVFGQAMLRMGTL